MHIVLELRWCGCCRRSGKRPLQVTLYSLHGRICEHPDVHLSPLPTTAHRRLRQWSSVWAQDRAARRISSEGPLLSLPLLQASVDTPHAVLTSHTKDVCHTAWTSPSVGISPSGHTAHSMSDSYSVCIAHTTPTSYICISHIEDVSPTLCMLLTPCPPHTRYTSHSMCIPHTPCIPRTQVYLTTAHTNLTEHSCVPHTHILGQVP